MNEKYIKSFPNNSGGICKNSLFRRLTMSSSSSKSYYGNVGDAVFYDSSSNSFVFLPASAITSKVDSYTPIGVVAIPTSHDVYGDGTCGVISLVTMSCDTPDTGSSSNYKMYFGGYTIDTPLVNRTVANYIGLGANLGEGVAIGAYTKVYLPSDGLSSISSLDGMTKYSSSSTSNRQAPSPFNSDGSRNEEYYTNSESSENIFQDFDGIVNTNTLIEYHEQSDWKTASFIENYYIGFPSACCCWRFYTIGTYQGQ